MLMVARDVAPATTPVAAKDWRACVVGACLQSSCGPNDGTVVVSMATNVADPAVGGTQGLLKGLLGGTSIYGPLGIIMSSVYATFPHALMIVLTALLLSDGRLYEAATTA